MISSDRYANAMTMESEYFKEWKDFIETLTVDWLVENFESSHRRRQKLTGMGRLSTYAGILEIQWEDIVYGFKSPPLNKLEFSGELTIEEDMKLLKCLPTDVLLEFIKVIEL